MSEEASTGSIGTARIDVKVNTGTMESGIEAAKRKVSGLGDEAASQFDKANASTKRYAESLLRQANLLGKSRAEQIAYNAQTRIGGELGEKIAARALAQQEALKGAASGAKALNDELKSASFGDSQLLKANQALATFKAKAADAAQAAKSVASQLSSQQFGDAQLLKVNRALGDLKAKFASAADSAKQATSALSSQQFSPAQLFTANKALANYRQGLAASNAESVKTSVAFGNTTKSAGELSFAMRSLPAQITDIFVGLSTGQRPLSVLLQQGGQLKDLFGGIAPAAKALASSLLGLLNPLTVSAGLLAALGYSFYQVDQEAAKDRETLKGFQQVINSTGNAAGVTAQGLAALSEQLGRGAEQASAYGAVLKELVGGGFVLGPSLGKVAQEVQAISEATGKTAAQVVGDYQKIFKDPAAASAELSQTLQFLSADQFALVQQLENTGEKGRAANIVITALNDALNGGTDSAEKYASKLAEISRQLDDIRSHPEKYNAGDLGGVSTSDALTADLEAQRRNAVGAYVTASLNEQDRQLSAASRESIAAQKRLAAFASPQDKLKNSLAQANKDRLAALIGVVDPASRERIEAEFKAQVKAANDTFQSAIRVRSPKKQAVSPEVSAFQTFSGQVDSLQIKNITGDNAALTQYQQGIRKLADQMAVYLSKSGDATKAAAEFNRGQQALAATLARSKQQETDAEKAYAAALDKSNQALADQVNAQIDRIGSGQKEFDRAQQITRAYQEQAAALADLALKRQMGVDGKSGGISKDQYDADTQALRTATDEKVRILQDGFKRQDAAQADWLNGAKAAYQDYVDQAADVAGQTYALFDNAFNGLGDALANFVTTGKLDFKGLVTSILTDLARMEVRIAASKILQSVVGAYFGGAGSGSSAFAGGGGSYSANTGGLAAYNVSPYAKGGVFADGASLSAYSGSVVSKPTMFAFARGAGVMGEAGPEAILPLRRGSDGRLGVAVAGGGSGGGVVLNQTINVDSSGSASEQTNGSNDDALRQFANRMKSVAQQTIVEEQRPGGRLWRMTHA